MRAVRRVSTSEVPRPPAPTTPPRGRRGRPAAARTGRPGRAPRRSRARRPAAGARRPPRAVVRPARAVARGPQRAGRRSSSAFCSVSSASSSRRERRRRRRAGQLARPARPAARPNCSCWARARRGRGPARGPPVSRSATTRVAASSAARAALPAASAAATADAAGIGGHRRDRLLAHRAGSPARRCGRSARGPVGGLRRLVGRAGRLERRARVRPAPARAAASAVAAAPCSVSAAATPSRSAVGLGGQRGPLGVRVAAARSAAASPAAASSPRSFSSRSSAAVTRGRRLGRRGAGVGRRGGQGGDARGGHGPRRAARSRRRAPASPAVRPPPRDRAPRPARGRPPSTSSASVAHRVDPARRRRQRLVGASASPASSWSTAASRRVGRPPRGPPPAPDLARRRRSPSRLTRISCRSAGLACRNAANSPCGSTTQLVNCSYGRPTASSTAASISAGVPASTSPRSPGGRAPVSSRLRSKPARQLLQAGVPGRDACPCRRGAPRGWPRTGRRPTRRPAAPGPRSPTGRARCAIAAPVAPARHRAVEREADRVEHGRLARAGRADQREEVGVGEVDGGRLAEHGEPVQVQPQRPHAVVTSS